MDAPMTPREAVAWLVENTAATRKTYCIILRSTNGVHNPGTRGMLICQAAELAGRLHAYRESLHHMMQAGMIPADLLDDVGSAEIMICYLITAGVVALGLLATWTSGRDVGYRNAMRDAERLHDDDAVFRPGKGGRQ